MYYRWKSARPTIALALACISLMIAAVPVQADQACAWSALTSPNRQQITCGDALVVERESGAEVTIFERAGDAPPREIELKNGAILIEVTPGSAPTQIRTPHAIAAVRGTTYVVDASQDSTSVFVIEGSVSVSKASDASTVTLGPGEGVDVGDAVEFAVTAWPSDRAASLLSRFGR
ncbi:MULTISPECIES: FecR domain-containing protein [Roseobacter]|uniref:FecR-like protein n=1 Tax=Roseobacter litoralis (strain ATCC 49566 / DSM 6996 / JCM 21268 / NBRC 15278 / OCh 149) TaxID=391595 RepID=F7ZFJ7_ROSLO|nr:MULTISPECIES: FecR family protein [Roseobacter]AEI96002.1 FecR-like protein [Roseobacter litoralis Och 149]GIT86246.1 membrane protein [Roseobacter sp. OBYS 0001]